AAGDAEILGQRINAHGVDAAFRQRVERRLDPRIRVERGRILHCSAARHDVPFPRPVASAPCSARYAAKAPFFSTVATDRRIHTQRYGEAYDLCDAREGLRSKRRDLLSAGARADLTGALGAAAAMSARPAMAQDEDDTIGVTAPRRDQALQEVPI